MRNSRLDRILYIQQILVQGGVLNKQQTAVEMVGGKLLLPKFLLV